MGRSLVRRDVTEEEWEVIERAIDYVEATLKAVRHYESEGDYYRILTTLLFLVEWFEMGAADDLVKIIVESGVGFATHQSEQVEVMNYLTEIMTGQAGALVWEGNK